MVLVRSFGVGAGRRIWMDSMTTGSRSRRVTVAALAMLCGLGAASVSYGQQDTAPLVIAADMAATVSLDGAEVASIDAGGQTELMVPLGSHILRAVSVDNPADVFLQVLDVEDTSEFDAGVAQEALRPAIEEITEKIANQADRFAGLKPVAPPAQIVGDRDGSIYINQGENFGVQVGQRFQVSRVVDEIRDANGNVLDRITDTVGVLEVTRVLSQSAICSVVEGEAAEGDTIEAL